ncbi:disulfide oxidoreductase [Peribacillus kribbensis]|uniref:disulfide oxidoreductase n=1 Tax=Peribacillus kribbensis TaxID=356658 RepID=UPI00041BAF85|nr:disulfide oxidoreductase [Peribacillus kribbensis]
MNRSLTLAWLAAVIAMLGSLFFSEVMKYIPCTLCWYQRILMYPLVFILGMAVYQRDTNVYRYVLPLSSLGMIVSVYHYTVQKIPFMKEFQVCSSGVPCSGQYINWLGFMTIPFLALLAFTIITICMIIIRRKTSKLP